MIGAINNIDKKQIVGWAAEDFNSKPIKVHLFINGKKMAHKMANEVRPYLLENKIHKSGKCGFTFNLKRFKVKPLKDKIEVKCLDTLTPTKALSQKIINKRRNILLKNKDVFFFIHIPKTAGTSFRNMLYGQFDQKYIYPNKTDIDANNNRYPKIADVKNIITKKYRSLHLFSGHYTYAMGLEILGNHFKPIVIFRDPIKRTISLLYQLKRMNEKYKNKNLEFVFDNEPNQVSNVQTYYMTGGEKPINQTPHQMDLALKRLEKLEVFGIVEQFDKSVELFEEKYNWKLGKPINLNKNPTKRPELEASLIEKIRIANNLDIQLYEKAVELFEKF